MRLLTPTENKRLNELIGFLCITLGLLMALALISYSPHDAAFNVSASGPEGSSVAKLDWARRRVRLRHALPSAWLCGVPTADGSAGTGLEMVPQPGDRFSGGDPHWIFPAARLAPFPFGVAPVYPAVRGAIPAGGLVGGLVSSGLLAGLNRGAYLVAPALLVVAIFMTTRFSFSGAHAWASGPNGPIGSSRKTGNLAEGCGALAFLERRP